MKPIIMRSMTLLLVLIAATGCSKTLGFNFTFGGADLSTGHDDLAMSLDLATAEDMVKQVDQAIPDLATYDQASSDLLSADLRGTADLAGKDLLAPDLLTPDLLQRDLMPISTRLGTACDKNQPEACGLGSQLECLIKFDTEAGGVDIADGYCSRVCDNDDICAPYGGVCRQLGKTGKYCMPSCLITCPRAGYTCCLYEAATPTVCQPPGAPGFLCTM